MRGGGKDSRVGQVPRELFVTNTKQNSLRIEIINIIIIYQSLANYSARNFESSIRSTDRLNWVNDGDPGAVDGNTNHKVGSWQPGEQSNTGSLNLSVKESTPAMEISVLFG